MTPVHHVCKLLLVGSDKCGECGSPHKQNGAANDPELPGADHATLSDAERFNQFLQSVPVGSFIGDIEPARRAKRISRWRDFCRRAGAATVVSFGGTVGAVACGIHAGATWREIVIRAIAVLLGGPVVGFLCGYGMFVSFMFDEAYAEAVKGRSGESMLPDSLWKFTRFFVFAGPTLVGVLIDAESGGSIGGLTALVLAGSIAAALVLLVADHRFGDGRRFD